MTLTIDSCTPAVQPSQTSTTSRNPLRTSRWARRERASVAWNAKIRVSTDEQHGKDRDIDPAVAPGLDPSRDRRRLGLQRHLKIAVLAVRDSGLIGGGRLGAMLASGIVKAGERLRVRDLVVEPERDRHRRDRRRH